MDVVPGAEPQGKRAVRDGRVLRLTVLQVPHRNRQVIRRALDLVHEIVFDDDLELHLRHEVDHVGAAAVDLFFAAGATEAFDLGDGHALHPDLAQRFFHFVELERLDDGLDLLQGDLSKAGYGRRAISCPFRGRKLIEKTRK